MYSCIPASLSDVMQRYNNSEDQEVKSTNNNSSHDYCHSVITNTVFLMSDQAAMVTLIKTILAIFTTHSMNVKLISCIMGSKTT